MNILFPSLLVACCIYAFLVGGRPERLGAGIYTVSCFASLFTYILFSTPSARFQSVEVGILVIDALTFVAFIMLAVRANRFWPIWVSALLGLGVLAHFARWAGPEVIPWAYAAVLSIWSYPILAIIAIGTFNHRRRMARGETDQPWSSRSPAD